MLNQYSRTELIIGKDGIEKLKKSKVVIFGLGGVGSYVAEGLARAGIGNFIIVDKDDVDITNINRQIIATHKTIGKPKIEVEKERLSDINPNVKIQTIQEFFGPDSYDFFDETIDYIIDAVDNITAKIEIIVRAKRHNIPVISCMGTGNKLDPTKFEISDISKTSVCPLAKIIRKELKNRNINNVKVLFSKEEPIKINSESYENAGINGKHVPGSISFVPSVAGLIIAGEVIKDLILD